MQKKRHLRTVKRGDIIKLANGQTIEIKAGRVELVIVSQLKPVIDFRRKRLTKPPQ